jgi:hypothetical protein
MRQKEEVHIITSKKALIKEFEDLAEVKAEEILADEVEVQ